MDRQSQAGGGSGGSAASPARQTVNPEFQVHRLNEQGLKKADNIAVSFDNLLNELKGNIPAGRELSLVQTHLEQACFYAKKAIAKQPENQLG